MIQLTEMPAAIAALPVDARGYPIPWFVAEVEGQRDFRIADQKKWATAVLDRLCWVCGTAMHADRHTFVIGPMCAVNRTTAEPPCHLECAEFSARNCPFLTMPKAVRREANMPCGTIEPAGEAIMRNPGVTCLWSSRSYDIWNDGKGGQLFDIGDHFRIQWFAHGREASRAEVYESIATGLPALQRLADAEGPEAQGELARRVLAVTRLFPKR